MPHQHNKKRPPRTIRLRPDFGGRLGGVPKSKHPTRIVTMEFQPKHCADGKAGLANTPASDAMAFWRRSFGPHLSFAFLLLSLTITPNVAAQANLRAAAKEVPPTSLDRPTTGQEILSKLVEYAHARETQLHQYSVIQTYVVKNQKGRALARATVRMQYQSPPGAKTFTTELARGSRLIRRIVFKPLMEQEAQTAAGRSQQASAIGPGNYTFDLLGKEHVEPYECFVVRAIPRRRDKYLFEGKIWINAEDFGIVKVTGRPARKPSFWIKQVDFVRDYQKVEQFWLPASDKAVATIRFVGQRTLTIDYADYDLTLGSDPPWKKTR